MTEVDRRHLKMTMGMSNVNAIARKADRMLFAAALGQIIAHLPETSQKQLGQWLRDFPETLEEKALRSEAAKGAELIISHITPPPDQPTDRLA